MPSRFPPRLPLKAQRLCFYYGERRLSSDFSLQRLLEATWGFGIPVSDTEISAVCSKAGGVRPVRGAAGTFCSASSPGREARLPPHH